MASFEDNASLGAASIKSVKSNAHQPNLEFAC